MKRSWLSLLVALFASALTAKATQSVNLAWDASPDPNVAGYFCYYGTAPGTYDQHVDVGNQTTTTISNLSDQNPYYFVVTAYTATQVESEPTNEVSTQSSQTPPASTPTPTPTATPILPIPSFPPTTVTAPPIPQLSASMQGNLDAVSDGLIQGWAWFSSDPNFQVTVDIYIDGLYYTSVLANVYRADLESAGIGDGTHGYVAAVPTSILDGQQHLVTTFYGSKLVALSAGPADRKSLVNVSVRGKVAGGDNVMIGGFIITGNVSKKVLLRGIGPSLANAGVSGSLSDPVLDLYDGSGALITENNNWRTAYPDLDPSLQPTDEREAVIETTLPPGAYSAVVKSADGSGGIALFELYDLEPGNSRTANLSSRGSVESGENVIIAGVIVGGDQPTTVIARAIGPTLQNSGVAGALQDPYLQLFDANGSLLFANDNWRSDQEQQISASGLAPSDDRESAVIASLAPGRYSAVVTGAGAAQGIGLVEVYNLEN